MILGCDSPSGASAPMHTLESQVEFMAWARGRCNMVRAHDGRFIILRGAAEDCIPVLPRLTVIRAPLGYHNLTLTCTRTGHPSLVILCISVPISSRGSLS